MSTFRVSKNDNFARLPNLKREHGFNQLPIIVSSWNLVRSFYRLSWPFFQIFEFQVFCPLVEFPKIILDMENCMHNSKITLVLENFTRNLNLEREQGLAEVNSEVEETKQKELNNWINEKLY